MAEYIIHVIREYLSGDFLSVESLDSGFLSKLPLYLIITNQAPVKVIRKILFHLINRRRNIMKSMHKQFAMVYTLLVFLLFTGCYTTFHAVRQDNGYDSGFSSEVYAEEDYYDYQYNDSYISDDQSQTETTELNYLPSRLVVEKTYYSYGEYVRKVRYVAYDPYPWMDPYYYDYKPNFHISFQIQLGSYGWYRPWIYVFAPPIYNPGWYPIVVYPDPWCYYPVWSPVCGPIYYPVPVYYDAPYYTHVEKKPYRKRDWDRRQPKYDRKSPRRPSSGIHEGTRNGSNSRDKTVRRPTSRSANTSERLRSRDRKGEDLKRLREVQDRKKVLRARSQTMDRKNRSQQIRQTKQVNRTSRIETRSSRPNRSKTVYSHQKQNDRRIQQKTSTLQRNKARITAPSRTKQTRTHQPKTQTRPQVRKKDNSRNYKAPAVVKPPSRTNRSRSARPSGSIRSSRKSSPPPSTTRSVKPANRASKKSAPAVSRKIPTNKSPEKSNKNRSSRSRR